MRSGDAALFYGTTNRRIAPRWQGPATILDIDETQTFKVARYPVRYEAEEKDAEDLELDPLQTRRGSVEASPRGRSTLRGGGNEMDVGEE